MVSINLGWVITVGTCWYMVAMWIRCIRETKTQPSIGVDMGEAELLFVENYKTFFKEKLSFIDKSWFRVIPGKDW